VIVKVLRCIKCNKEKRIVSENRNMLSYDEKVVKGSCQSCGKVVTNEEKLLLALTGQKLERLEM